MKPSKLTAILIDSAKILNLISLKWMWHFLEWWKCTPTCADRTEFWIAHHNTSLVRIWFFRMQNTLIHISTLYTLSVKRFDTLSWRIMTLEVENVALSLLLLKINAIWHVPSNRIIKSINTFERAPNLSIRIAEMRFESHISFTKVSPNFWWKVYSVYSETELDLGKQLTMTRWNMSSIWF